MSKQRFRDWGADESARVTPLPSPGVYARHNAVDLPARLPDGTYSRESVSRILTPRSPRPAIERSDGEESR